MALMCMAAFFVGLYACYLLGRGESSLPATTIDSTPATSQNFEHQHIGEPIKPYDNIILKEKPFIVDFNYVPHDLVFNNNTGEHILTIRGDGTIEIEKGYTPDKASKEFLDALAKAFPQWKAAMCEGK